MQVRFLLCMKYLTFISMRAYLVTTFLIARHWYSFELDWNHVDNLMSKLFMIHGAKLQGLLCKHWFPTILQIILIYFI